MSTFTRHLHYGDDAEFDSHIEKQIDPEWTGHDVDPLGWAADRAADRAERQMDERWSA